MDKKNKKIHITGLQMSWGVTVLTTSVCCILFVLFLTHLSDISEAVSSVISVAMPLIMGLVMAYLLLPLYDLLFEKMSVGLRSAGLAGKHADRIARVVSTILSILFLVAIVTVLLLMAIPQVIQSVGTLMSVMPDNIDRLTDAVNRTLEDNPDLSKQLVNAIDNMETDINTLITKYVTPSLETIVSGLTLSVISIVKTTLNLVIGIIVCVYVLNAKQVFGAQGKKLIYSIFKRETGDAIIGDLKDVHRIFSGFITGKIIDSLIIGAISFVVLSIMKMPYAMMISVFVGVTNIIPFFGPFIGAIPSFFIVLMVSPIQSLYFLIYIVVIQQIDGNIIGPKILGDSTGLPSFWVLFAIILFGGLFGFVGMILGVPVMATIYLFVTKYVNSSLEKKGLSSNTADYYRGASMTAAASGEDAEGTVNEDETEKAGDTDPAYEPDGGKELKHDE